MLDSANVMLVGGGRRCQVDRSVSQQGRSVTRGSRDTHDAASSSGLIKHQPVTKLFSILSLSCQSQVMVIHEVIKVTS